MEFTGEIKMVSTNTRPDCFHEYEKVMDKYCAAYLCIHCGYHKDLARCYCGWSLTGLDGREELEQSGENIEDNF